MADPRERVPLDRFPPHLWITSALVLLTVLYAFLHVGVARSHAGMHISVARPPVISATVADPSAELASWRDAYWHGHIVGGAHHSSVMGMLVQTLVFTAAAVALLLLRSSDLTAHLSVLALALSGVAGGGPLLGAELSLPLGLGRLLTVFTWLAGPIAFPIIALAIGYFPTPSPLLNRYRWLKVVPFATAAPMIATATATALYLVGVNALRDAAVWDATHQGVYFTSFAAFILVTRQLR